MDKKRVKSNSKILPAMLTQMMADDTRFDEVVDIFINEVDNEVIHHSDLGAISVEMIASDEFEPKTKVEEVKEAYVHARSEDDIREIDTGLTHKIDYIILGDVQGQLSDGIWENSPAMNKYWKHLDTEFKDGKVYDYEMALEAIENGHISNAEIISNRAGTRVIKGKNNQALDDLPEF